MRCIALHRAQQCRPADLSPELTSYASVGASQPVRYAAPDYYLEAPCASHQMITQGFDRLAAPIRPAAAPAPRSRQHDVCHGSLPTAEAALGLQPAASAVSSWGNQLSYCRQRWRNTQSGSRAAATRAIHRAAPCAAVPPGQFTPGTDELCSGRCHARPPACCAQLTSASSSRSRAARIMRGFARLSAPVRAADAPALHGQLSVAYPVGTPLPAAAFGPPPAASAVLLWCLPGECCAARRHDSHCQGDLPSCYVPAIATHFVRGGISRNSAAGTCAASHARDESGSGSLRSSSKSAARREVNTLVETVRQAEAEHTSALNLRWRCAFAKMCGQKAHAMPFA